MDLRLLILTLFSWWLRICISRLGEDLEQEGLAKQQSLSWDVWVSHGFHIPRVGLGTAALGRKTAEVMVDALSSGVRLIDSAQAPEWYSEKGVGDGIVQFCDKMPGNRDELWDLIIVTKIHPRSYREDKMREMISRSKSSFYSGWNPSKESLDIVLLHSPYCWAGHCTKEEETHTWQEAWRNLEKLKQEGIIRAIGVSNFDRSQLEELETLASTRIAVVQNWMDPFNQDVESRMFCKAHGITYMAYSSMGTQWEAKFPENNPVLTDKTLLDIAHQHQTSVGAVVSSWLLQEGVIAIPRASKLEHIRENAFHKRRLGDGSLPVFLSPQDIDRIRNLDGSKGLPWDGH